jgi:DNA ligase (NAD+)
MAWAAALALIAVLQNALLYAKSLQACFVTYFAKQPGKVSAKTSFLLAGSGIGPSKLAKAESLGVPLLSETEFLALLPS